MDRVTPALASLFSESGVAESWTKLDDSHKYSRFCHKYWGESIEDEAKRWRSSEPTVENNLANEIGPNCYGLDLDMRFKCSKMWVRQDYIRIYEYCEKQHREGPSSAEERARSVVVTGQPGIGKTYWVTYAIRRRLGEEKPFLWYLNGDCFLFMADGVFRQNVKQISAGAFMPFLWAFVDADSHPNGVHHRLAALDTNLFIIHTTSPKRKRWTTLTKYTSCAVIVMNPWHLEELRQAARISGLSDEQQAVAVANFEKLGPIPRICIDFAKDPGPLPEYEQYSATVIADLTPQSFRRFALNCGALNLNNESHHVFIVRRNEVDDLERAHIEPISANVELQLITMLNKLQHIERIELYHAFASVSPTRAVAGLMYEALAHTLLQKGVTLALERMEESFKQTRYHWKTQSEEQASNSIDQDDSPPRTSIRFPCTPAIIYKGDLTSIEPDRLYIPEARNQASIDSFCKLAEFFYIIQLTVSHKHDIKRAIEYSLPTNLMDLLPPKKYWRFVFISPPGCEVDIHATSAVKESLGGVSLYSTHLSIEQQQKFVTPPEDWEWNHLCSIM